VSADLWSQILLPLELDWLESLPVSVQANIATLLFSAKEAFYKCQYEVTQQWLEFRDITLDFFSRNLERNSFAVHPVGKVKLFEESAGPVIVRFAFTRELVVTAITLPAH
jgi:4'-phosphopantetheinyl transferase EntD